MGGKDNSVSFSMAGKRCVVNKVSFSMAIRGLVKPFQLGWKGCGQNVSFSIAGRGRGQKVSFSMSRKECGLEKNVVSKRMWSR
jgi:hypothetical protein